MTLSKFSKLIVVILFPIIFVSCATKEIRLVDPPANFPLTKVLDTDRGIVIISYAAAPNNISKSRQDFYNNINDFRIILRADEDSIATIEMKKEIIGEYYKNSNANVVFFASGIAENISIDADDLFYEIQIRTNDKEYRYVQNYNQLKVIEEDPSMVTYSYMDEITDDGCKFGMFAIRLKPIEDEWIPNSNHMTALMQDQKGREIWSSAFNQNFMQMVYPVFPEDIGTYHKYEHDWRGNWNNGSPAKPGLYIVNMTINSKPENYNSTINLNWKQND
jgi:hypothetical protein